MSAGNENTFYIAYHDTDKTKFVGYDTAGMAVKFGSYSEMLKMKSVHHFQIYENNIMASELPPQPRFWGGSS